MDQKKLLDEFSCIIGLDEIIRGEKATIEEILTKSIQYIMSCREFPNITGAQLTYQGKKFKTVIFKKTKWKLKIPLQIKTKTLGYIEVFFQKDPKTFDQFHK